MSCWDLFWLLVRVLQCATVCCSVLHRGTGCCSVNNLWFWLVDMPVFVIWFCLSICDLFGLFSFSCVCIYTWINVYEYMYAFCAVHVCIYVYMYICIYVYMYIRIHPAMCIYVYMYICMHQVMCIYFDVCIGACKNHVFVPMGWLQLVGSIKLQVFCAEYCLFYRALLQMRPIILSILLTEATPYLYQWRCV